MDMTEMVCSAFESRGPASNGLLPLPISRSLFEKISGDFKISPDYLTVLSTGVATFLSPSFRGGCEDWEHARKLHLAAFDQAG
jgi:hypothetical protein